MRKYLLLIALPILLISCSSNLSREKAADIIKAQYHFPMPIVGAVPKVLKVETIYTSHISDAKRKMEQNLEEWFSKGLIFPSNSMEAAFMETYRRYDISLEKEGQKYLISSDHDNYYVKLFDVDFDHITGIVEYEQPKKYAQVTFTLKKINQTPFDEYRLEKSYDIERLYKNQNRFLDSTVSVNIVKYDDRWRFSPE